jgi:integrase
MYGTVRHILNCACGDELLPVNPADKLPPHVNDLMAREENPDEGKPFTAEEFTRFLTAALRHSKLHPLYLAGGQTGMRLGELCGWQLDDIEGRTALVRRSLGQECSMRDPKPGPTKTRKARRVDLSTRLAAVLADIKGKRPALTMAKGWRPMPPWVFITSKGTPYSQRNVYRDFQRIVIKAGLAKKGELSPWSPHSLRHTFACLHLLHAKDRNVIQYVQQQLGHSSIKLTVDCYGKWIRIQDPEAADRLDALVSAEQLGSGLAANALEGLSGL